MGQAFAGQAFAGLAFAGQDFAGQDFTTTYLNFRAKMAQHFVAVEQ